MLPMRDDDTEPVRWQEFAACQGMDPAPFFAEDAGGGTTVYESVRPICAACPVQPACLEHALTRQERFGFWGGASEAERRRIRRQRARNRAGGVVSLFDQDPT